MSASKKRGARADRWGWLLAAGAVAWIGFAAWDFATWKNSGRVEVLRVTSKFSVPRYVSKTAVAMQEAWCVRGALKDGRAETFVCVGIPRLPVVPAQPWSEVQVGNRYPIHVFGRRDWWGNGRYLDGAEEIPREEPRGPKAAAEH